MTMHLRLILLMILGVTNVDVLGRKMGRDRGRKWPRKFPRPYPWMLYSSNYNPAVEENGCVDIRPECESWAHFPGYCEYAKGYMTKHCRRSCRMCKYEEEAWIGKTSASSNEVCEDRLEDCKMYIKTQSQCNLFSGLMKKYCSRTCGFCCHDLLNDCSLFIKNPSQCGRLNGFFRKYCPHTCKMCGFLLPLKKPGCQDELDGCKSFGVEHCKVSKSFYSKYCAKTCGFCEEKVYLPEGTTKQIPFDPTKNAIGRTTTAILQDSNQTRVTRIATKPQNVTPSATVRTPADIDMSSQTTEISHIETTMSDTGKSESLMNTLMTNRTITSEISKETNESSGPKTTVKTLRTTTLTKVKITEIHSNNRFEDSKPASVTEEISIRTSPFTEPSTTDGRSSGAKNSGFTSQKKTTAHASDKAPTLTTTRGIVAPKTNSSRKTLGRTSFSTDHLATSTPSQRKETEPLTTKTLAYEHFISASSTAGTNAMGSITKGTESLETSTSSPSVVTEPPNTQWPKDNSLSSPNTLKPVTEVSSTSTVNASTNVNTGDSAAEAASSFATSNTGNPTTADSSSTKPAGEISNPAKTDTEFPSSITVYLNTVSLSPSNAKPLVGASRSMETDTVVSSPHTGSPYSASPSNTKQAGDVSPSTETDSEDSSTSTGSPYSASRSNTKPDVVVSISTDAGTSPNYTLKPEIEVPTPSKTDNIIPRPSRVTGTPTSAKETSQSYSPTASTQIGSTGVSSSTVKENPDLPDSILLQDKQTAIPQNAQEQNIEAVTSSPRPTTSFNRVKKDKTRKGACMDKLPECASYVQANINYCKFHVHFMHDYCSKSCGFCGKETESLPKCEDVRKKKCQYFSRYPGYCTVNQKYMRERCPKSCGFCGVAPGSAPMDRTFVRTDQKYDFYIRTEWDGKVITHAPIKITLSAEDNISVRLEVSGPFFNQPRPPPCDAGKPCWQLWNYEVAEVFFLGEKEKYLELEVSPHGPHLLLLLDGVRKPFKTKLPMRYSATVDLKSMTWNGTAIVPIEYFPPGMRKINAYAIHGPDTNKIYESLYPAKQIAYPDFHRLEFFRDFNFKSMFPSGWNQPISPLWLKRNWFK